MVSLSILLTATGVAGLVSTTPIGNNATTTTTSHSTTTSTTQQHPCEVIATSLAMQIVHGHLVPPYQTATVEAGDAHACLRSKPLEQVKSVKSHLDGLKHFIQFQSTLAYLKDPPAGYLYPGVDLTAQLDTLAKDFSDGLYDNQYDFQLDLYRLIQSAQDGHLSYVPDFIGLFNFLRPFDLVSLSVDGVSIPEVYAYPDLLALQDGNSSLLDYIPSPIVEVQGKPVEEFLSEQANLTSRYQDPDGSYNSLFPNNAYMATGRVRFSGSFYSNPFYGGNSTTFSFQNGTNLTIPNIASFNPNNIHTIVSEQPFQDTPPIYPSLHILTKHLSQAYSPDGEHLSTQKLEKGGWKLLDSNTSHGLVAKPVDDHFPPPIESHPAHFLTGYFLDSHDAAILSVSNFMSTSMTEYTVSEVKSYFKETARRFITESKAAGKTKLMIDLRGNPGGLMVLGYALFSELFPTLDAYAGTNARASPLVDALGSSPARKPLANGFSAFLSWDEFLNSSLGHFVSWQDFFGPQTLHNDNFTTLARYPVQECTNINSSEPAHAPIFAPEDMIVILDGKCSSTCGLFTEAMRTEAGVKQIVIGGRAQYGPMQGVGGTKGAQVVHFEEIWESMTQFRRNITGYDNMEYAIERGSLGSGGVNLRNSIRRGDETFTPLQFVYDAADCRLFFTPDMYGDQRNVWQAVYQAAWGNGTCVPGSSRGQMKKY